MTRECFDQRVGSGLAPDPLGEALLRHARAVTTGSFVRIEQGERIRSATNRGLIGLFLRLRLLLVLLLFVGENPPDTEMRVGVL